MTSIEKADFTVSILNNVLEAVNDIENDYDGDIVDEAGFGYDPDEPEQIYSLDYDYTSTDDIYNAIIKKENIIHYINTCGNWSFDTKLARDSRIIKIVSDTFKIYNIKED